MTTVIPPVHVEIDLDESLAPLLNPDGRQVLHARVLGLLGDMIEDLGVPAGVELSLKEPQPLGRRFRVRVNGEPIPVPRLLKPSEATTARELALIFARVLDASRESLIGEAVAQGLREQWSTRDGGSCLLGLSRQDFRLYLQALARRGFRLKRGAGLDDTARSVPERWTPEECFERAVPSMANLKVILHHGNAGWLEPAAEEALIRQLTSMQDTLFYQLGVRIPDVLIQEDRSLEAGEWRVQINDLRLPPCVGFDSGEFLINETSSSIQRLAGSLVVLEGIEYELGRLAQVFADLVRITRARFPVTTLTQVLRNLVDERVSILNLRGILEALLATRTTIHVDAGKYIVFTPYATAPYISGKAQLVDQLGAAELAECVRSQLKRYLSHQHTWGNNVLSVYLIDRAIERRLADERPLEPKEWEALLGAIETEMLSLRTPPSVVVILTSIEVRRRLWLLVRAEFPGLAVLSYQELSPDLNIQPLSRITWDLG